MSQQMTRGGRAFFNDLRDQVQIMRQALTDARAASKKAGEVVKWHPDLSRELLEKNQAKALAFIADALDTIDRMREDRLDPMLRRRATHDDLGERVATLEKQLSELKRQLGALQGQVVRDRAVS